MLKKLFLSSLVLALAFSFAYSQTEVDSARARLIGADQQKRVYEKFFAHTDKEFYLAGEIIWFKLYYVDAASHTALDLSQVAYVDVVDKDFRPVLQGKIALNEGTGEGSFYVPVSISSGMYRMRVYTHWMKNFSTAGCFEKTLTIVNTFKPLETPPAAGKLYEVSFFPEGGDLVENLQSKLAFKVADRFGKGPDYSGIIVNQDGDTILSFRPKKFGIGSIMFTPKSGDNYQAKVTLPDTIISIALPKARTRGYVMSVTRPDDGRLIVRVTTNESQSFPVSVVVNYRESTNFTMQAPISNGVAEFVIDKTKLGPGISRLTVTNHLNQPLCERLVFISPSPQLKLDHGISSREFSRRTKVGIHVYSKDEQGKTLPANMSVSVYKLDGMNGSKVEDISSYLWLTSHLRGTVESPAYYLNEHGADVDEATDNLMLTHGWRRFVQEITPAPRKDQHTFLPELTSHIVQARIINTKTGQPAPNMLAYLSVPGRRVQLYSSKSDSSGHLKFYTTDLYGSNEIMLQTEEQGDTSYRFEVISPFAEKFSDTKLPAFELSETIRQALTDHNVAVQVQNAFVGERLRQLFSPAIDSTGFFGPPDNSYILDDYVRFSTMEEVLREYVVEVLVRRQRENFRLVMSGGLDNRVFLDDPLTLFNGVPVFDANKIMQYDPLKIHKIEVVKRRYFYGSAIMNGIVNFVTYQPDPVMLSGLRAVVFDYEGMQLHREFYSPVYETQEQLLSRLPDFRNVLYWAPTLKSGPDGRAGFDFYTSDDKGEYAVVVQGMNAQGKSGSHIFTFTVK